MIAYWPETLPQAPANGFTFAPLDVQATFQPAVGPPISRPRTTGAPMEGQAGFTLINDQIQTFETFYGDTLAQGTVRFVLRDSVGDTGLRYWRFIGVYTRRFSLKNIATVQAKILMLPGVPWFAPYGREGLSVVPSFVADYDEGVYGIDGVKGPASDLPSIAGTFLVRRITTASVTTGQETLTAGDITEAQPSGTLSIVGWPL